jgi:methyltransferase (TIGR00027 family)
MSVEARPKSSTAVMVASYRARATERHAGLCSDPWAASLAGDEGAALAQRFDAGFPHMELWIAVRTAYLDDKIRRLVAPPHDVRQVVILGAGLDTRAARLARAGVRFFEVDQPATQADKLARLRALAGYPIDAASYAACDFEHDDFLDRLVAAGFRTGEPAAILWEGVVPYLTEDAVRATLRRIASGCHPRSTLVFDYLMRRMAEGTSVRPKDHEVRAQVSSYSEPVRFGTNDVLPMLYEEGFRHVRTISFDECCLTLTGTYAREREFRFQHLALCSVTPPPRPT